MEKDDFRFAVRHDALETVDTLFHLGACSSTTERNASYLIDNNTRTTRELCEWCIDHDVRFVYASSAATYGACETVCRDDEDALDALRPLNPYGYSKHLFDLWARRRGLFDRIVGLKYFNVFGPREQHKGDMRSMVVKAREQIRNAGAVALFRSHRPDYADGEQVRDFLYVKDAVAATLHFQDPGSGSGLFNCGTGQPRTWNDLVRAVFAALNREPDIRYVDMPEALRGRYQYRTCSDPSKLRAAGFDAPFTSLEDGVLETVRRLEAAEA
jgi:ADP-L-glycero-D-manno-heptose 6-epimerase